MNNYLPYPMKNMKITQTYTGKTSHLPHTTGTPKDYPIDEAGKDAGKDAFYAPCQVKVSRIYGVGTSGANTLWLESTEKVKTANGRTDHVSFMIIHPNDSDLKKLKVGQVIKKGEIVCFEGSDAASANHLHICVGLGKIKGTGWIKSSTGKWVLTTKNGTAKPEEVFFIDKKFTTVIKSGGLKFKDMPVEKKYRILKRTNIRNGAGTSFLCVGTYEKGTIVTGIETVTNSKGNKWLHTDKGYITFANVKKV